MENKSREFSFQISVLSIIIYLNGFAIQLLLYFEIGNFSFNAVFENTFLERFFPTEKYDTMDRSWFSHIGAGVIFTTMIKIINPSTIIFVKALISRYFLT